MLKFNNIEKTSANFNGASFTLTTPEDWDSIGDGPTRESVLAWLAIEGNVPELFVAPPPPTTAEIKASQWEAIKAKREHLSDTGGYAVNIPHTVITNTTEIVNGTEVITPVETIVNTLKWFHSDGKSKTQQLGLTRKADRLEVSGGDMTAPFAGPGPGGTLPWKTMDGSYVLMTGNLAQAIFAAAEEQDMAIFAVADYHGVKLKASANPVGYDFSTGWPPVYSV